VAFVGGTFDSNRMWDIILSFLVEESEGTFL